ncbi:MAG: serine hydrolase [Gemmatimonadota bacterium]|nr:MAG: serine hydrolase [Gemmatimonadota bacterium]
MHSIVAFVLLPLAVLSHQTTALAQPRLAEARPASDQTAALDSLDAFIGEVMEEWQVPGLATAVVKDGELVLLRGYGHRDVDEQLPVTPRTLFAIGSITKSFTVTVLGMLADEGRLDWDLPVRTYLPDFQLYDDMATLRMTPRDLVTHRSGLPRHDGLWYGSALTRRELYERLRYLEPSEDFRGAYQYQNLMFMTAGFLAGQLSGTRWEDVVRERIFGPLGMSRSNFSVTESQRSDDFAYPYTKVGDDVRQVDFRNIDEVGPAGSINSSVEEMIRYVQFHIEKGEYGEEQLLSEANAEQMQTPQTAIQSRIVYDELGHGAYGMGFRVTSYRGHKVVQHGGGIDGFIALLSFMPRDRIGMIILTNQGADNPVPTIVARRVYDQLLGLEPVDWAGRVKEEQARAREVEEGSGGSEADQRVEGTSTSHDLSEYVGTFEHPGYGTVGVSLDADGLVVTFNDVTSPLVHFHYDVFEVPENPLVPFEGLKVMFLYNKQGEIDRLLVPLEPRVDDIVFVRLPDDAATGGS